MSGFLLRTVLFVSCILSPVSGRLTDFHTDLLHLGEDVPGVGTSCMYNITGIHCASSHFRLRRGRCFWLYEYFSFGGDVRIFEMTPKIAMNV